MSRAADERVTGRLDRAHLRAPRGRAKGVPLYRGISSSTDSPLSHWKRHTYECLRMVDPNREPADSKLSTSSLKYWGLH
jgi:hypothetical protein